MMDLVTIADKQNLEKVVSINRITKVTKGGKKLSFSALVVVGDTNGHVGYSLAKAGEVADAIRKSLSKAKKAMVKVERKGTSIHHDILSEFGATKVLLKPAVEGTGIIATAPIRAICEAAGIKDILSKCLKSNNPINVIKATMKGLLSQKIGPTTISQTKDAAKPD